MVVVNCISGTLEEKLSSMMKASSGCIIRTVFMAGRLTLMCMTAQRSSLTSFCSLLRRLSFFAWAGSAEDGYTKIEKTFEVHKRNKPSDYVFTPVDQKTLDDLQKQIGDLADLTTEAKENLVAAINEAAASGGSESMDLRVADGYIQYSTDSGSTWENLIAVADLKGAKGDKGDTGAQGAAGHTPVKGTDYWTAADKQEIVNNVLAALPDGTEVSY